MKRKVKLSLQWPFVLITVLLVTLSSAWTKAQQAPMLQQMVEAGELPPLAERLPENPAVVEPVEQVGTYGGTWNMGVTSPDNWTMPMRAIGYERLMRWDADWQTVVPNIAESVEVNDAGTEYTIHLREGMKWSDGVPFTADDIIFGYEDVLSDPDLIAGPFEFHRAGGKPTGAPAVAEKIDDYTVKFTFEEPSGLFLYSLAHPGGAFLSFTSQALSGTVPR